MYSDTTCTISKNFTCYVFTVESELEVGIYASCTNLYLHYITSQIRLSKEACINFLRCYTRLIKCIVWELGKNTIHYLYVGIGLCEKNIS